MCLRPISIRSNPGLPEELKFSPPVQDFDNNGFRLIGGRLDYLNGREVAALVYQRNKHIINLFIWPSEAGQHGSRQAFVEGRL